MMRFRYKSLGLALAIPMGLAGCVLIYFAVTGYTLLQGSLQNNTNVQFTTFGQQLVSFVVFAPVVGATVWVVWKIYKGPQPRKVKIRNQEEDEEE